MSLFVKFFTKGTIVPSPWAAPETRRAPQFYKKSELYFWIFTFYVFWFCTFKYCMFICLFFLFFFKIFIYLFICRSCNCRGDRENIRLVHLLLEGLTKSKTLPRLDLFSQVCTCSTQTTQTAKPQHETSVRLSKPVCLNTK